MMSQFDKKAVVTGNHFVKSDKKVLKAMYGREDVFPLWIADMDFEVAPCITKALQEVVKRGVYSYEFQPSSLYQVMSDWHKKRHDLELNPRNFVFTPSVLSAIALIIQEFTNKGDSILIQPPVYHMFDMLITKGERKVVTNYLKLDADKYVIDFEDLESKIISERVKMMILCNPHNPIGRVWRKEEVQQLVNLLQKHKVLLVSDEIHADVLFGKNKFTSTAVFDYENQLVLLGSPAKTFGMQGIANGFIYANNNEYRKRIKTVSERLAIDHGSSLTGHATLAAYSEGEEWLDEMLTYLQETVVWVNNFIDTELPQLKITQPEGTYLLWIDFRGLNLNEEKLNELLVHEAKVVLGKGESFGQKGFMRMTIASPLSTIQQAFYQLKSVIDKL
jgi:cystathionine beta-lyase